MSRLIIYLLGPPRIELDGDEVHIGRRKALALLAYLAVERRRRSADASASVHSRDALATLLWPEYDQRDARSDINVVFPIDRFRELEEEGFIGELAEINYGLGMGRMYKRTALQTQMAAEIAREIKRAAVDVLFCVPA